MAAIFEFNDRDKLATINIRGVLTREELDNVQSQCEQKIQQVGKIDILVIVVDFSGWHKEDGWEDLSFAERNDAHLGKIAIVGDLKWKDLVYAFTVKGLRPVDIEYFSNQQEIQARSWLDGLDL